VASEQDNKAISALIVALKTIHSYTEWPKKQSNTLLRRASKLRYGEKSGWLTDIAAKKSANIYGYFYRAPRRARLTQQSAASCIPRPPPAPAHCTPSTSVVKYNTHTHTNFTRLTDRHGFPPNGCRLPVDLLVLLITSSNERRSSGNCYMPDNTAILHAISPSQRRSMLTKTKKYSLLKLDRCDISRCDFFSSCSTARKSEALRWRRGDDFSRKNSTNERPTVVCVF